MSGRVVPRADGLGFETASAVVLIDPATGLPYAATGGAGLTNAQLRAAAVPMRPMVTDSTGATFNPDACSHAYAYTNGLLTTDTATDGAASWVKTYTYTSGVLSAESKWVKQ